MNREGVRTKGREFEREKLIGQIAGGAALLAMLLAAAPVSAQVATSAVTTATMPTTPTVTPIEVRIVEWDLPPSLDMQAGAMMIDTHGRDNNRVWFVTRIGASAADPARIVRFDPARSLTKGLANWTSWDLNENPPAVPGFSGGLKRMKTSYDRRFIFVRTQNNLQRIDTGRCDDYHKSPQTCERTLWADQLGDNTSDVTVDSSNNVFSAYSPGSDPTKSYIQMLRPGAPIDGAMVPVKRWQVGATGPSGAGFCAGAMGSFPCLSGIAVHPDYSNLVYFSEPNGNNIAELDIKTGCLKRWSLTDAGIQLKMFDLNEPRNLNIDRKGKVWVVTGSGHVVSLDPRSNNITAHQAPLGEGNDPYAVAPDDDVIGYTGSGSNKVGMVHPKGRPAYVRPTYFYPMVTYPNVRVTVDRSFVRTGTATPVPKRVFGEITRKDDGTFVEAHIDTNQDFTNNDSSLPLGITPNKSKAEGTFFYGVGLSTNVRIGHARLAIKEKVKCPRDDEDPDDGWDAEHNRPGHNHGEYNDADDDGLDDDYDGPTTKENQQTADAAALGPGQSVSFPVTATSTSLAVIVKTTSEDNPVAQLVLSLSNAAGVPVGTSVIAPGTAVTTLLLPSPGTYTARVQNMGLTSVTHTATTIVREAWNLIAPIEPPLGSTLLPTPVDPTDPW